MSPPAPAQTARTQRRRRGERLVRGGAPFWPKPPRLHTPTYPLLVAAAQGLPLLQLLVAVSASASAIEAAENGGGVGGESGEVGSAAPAVRALIGGMGRIRRWAKVVSS